MNPCSANRAIAMDSFRMENSTNGSLLLRVVNERHVPCFFDQKDIFPQMISYLRYSWGNNQCCQI